MLTNKCQLSDYAKYYDSLNQLAPSAEAEITEADQDTQNDDGDDDAFDVIGTKRGFDDDAEDRYESTLLNSIVYLLLILLI